MPSAKICKFILTFYEKTPFFFLLYNKNFFFFLKQAYSQHPQEKKPSKVYALNVTYWQTHEPSVNGHQVFYSVLIPWVKVSMGKCGAHHVSVEGVGL